MEFWKDVGRWVLAGFPIMGWNFVAMYGWKLILPTWLAYWAAIIGSAPITLWIWRKIESFKRDE